MEKILIVDDEERVSKSIREMLEDEGYTVSSALSGQEALEIVEVENPDLMLLDISMPGMDGMEVLRIVRDKFPSVIAIMISAYGTIGSAVSATKLGAYNFIEKPFDMDKMLVIIRNALRYKKLEQENIMLRRKVQKRYELTGESDLILDLKKKIERVAPTNSWVLISGENGTGKELVARAIHKYSRRSDRPFIEVNCAAIPDELIESELFGYEKGAFTGATEGKKGKFDLADGGTIFLDEIADMSLKTQSKILRILEEHRFSRVGGIKPLEIDVRIIAATNKDLSKEIKNGNFREDLYYRLNVIPFHVPPLRERREDIPLLVDYYLKFFSTENSWRAKKIMDDAMEILTSYHWPGNVRELKNCIERLVIMTPSDTISASDIPDEFRADVEEKDPRSGITVGDILGKEEDLSIKDACQRFEMEFIQKKLEEAGGNISKAAKILGMDRSNLSRKIKALGLMVR